MKFIPLAFFFLLITFQKKVPFNFDQSLIKKSQYSHTKTNLRVAKGAKKTGAILGGEQENGEVHPIKIGFNDPGYVMMVGLLAKAGFSLDSIIRLANLNLFFYLSSLLIFYFVFSASFSSLLHHCLFWISSYIFYSKFGFAYTISLVDQHGLIPSLGILVLSLFILIIKFRTKIGLSHYLLLVTIIGSFVIGLVALLRGSLGYASILAFILSLLFALIFYSNGKSKKFLFFVPVLVIAIFKFTFAFPQKIIFAQTYEKLNQSYSNADIEPKKHGSWHNLYIGLGYLPNKWDIKWSDKVGFDHAQKFNPEAIYPSPLHYEVMKKLFFKYLMTHPFEAIKNYLIKVFIVLGKLFLLMSPYILLIAGIIIFQYRKNWSRLRIKLREKAYWSLILIPAGALFAIPVATIPAFDGGFKTFASFALLYISCLFIKPNFKQA